MKKKSQKQLMNEIRIVLLIFITALLFSGLTAFAVEPGLHMTTLVFRGNNDLSLWFRKCYYAVTVTNEQFPFLAYGTDWLAYSHILFAILFADLFRDPVRYIWLTRFGFIACLGIIPVAAVTGHIRNIPFFWQLIDMSFGIIGAIPLYMICRRTRLLESAHEHKTDPINSSKF